MKTKKLVYSSIASTILCTVNLAQAEQNSTAQLDTIQVVGSIAKTGTLSYDQARSIAVIDQSKIAELNSLKVDQALNYQSGILTAPFGNDNKAEWFRIRGFNASTTLDGTQTSPNGFFVWLPETYGLESIEVLKGADSNLYGASETGGIVNLITKRPTATPQGEIITGGGNKQQRSVAGDYSGWLNKSGSLRYRLVAQYRKQNGQQDYTRASHYYIAPSLAWDISNKTSFTLLTSFQREDGVPTSPFNPPYATLIPTPEGKIQRKTFFGEPARDDIKRVQIGAGYELRHEFENGWIASQNYRFSHLYLDLLTGFAYGASPPREALRGYSYAKAPTRTHSVDNRASKTWNFNNGIEYTLLMGVDYLNANTKGINNGFGLLPNIDLFNPVYGQPFEVSASPYRVKTNQWGYYTQNKIRINNAWVVDTGFRRNKVRGSSTETTGNGSYNITHNTVNAGLSYLFESGFVPYFSFSESFRPITGTGGDGRLYRPYEGTQYEWGTKYAPSWVDGTFSIAYFYLKEKNALIPDPSNIQVQAGKRKNRGLELQADFNLTDDWKVNTSYTHNHSRQDVSTERKIRTPLVARHMGSAFSSYTFSSGWFEGLTLGAGVRYVGSTTDDQYNPGYSVKSYTLLDIMARYVFLKNWQLQFNASNISNKIYISGCDFYCYYGSERQLNLSIGYKF